MYEDEKDSLQIFIDLYIRFLVVPKKNLGYCLGQKSSCFDCDRCNINKKKVADKMLFVNKNLQRK